MREPKDGDNMRLLAAELILDRGVGALFVYGKHLNAAWIAGSIGEVCA